MRLFLTFIRYLTFVNVILNFQEGICEKIVTRGEKDSTVLDFALIMDHFVLL